jgi:hypothetical protein
MTKEYTFKLEEEQVDAIVLEDLMWSHQLQLKYITEPKTREGESIQEIMDLYDALTKVLSYHMTRGDFNSYMAQCNDLLMDTPEEKVCCNGDCNQGRTCPKR